MVTNMKSIFAASLMLASASMATGSNLTCPKNSPQVGAACSSANLRCNYGLYRCPDGSNHSTIFAHCDGFKWSIAQPLIVCPPMHACPKNAPSWGSACTNASLSCNYHPHTCPDGSKHFTTFANCDGSSWQILVAMIVCPPLRTCPVVAPSIGGACSNASMRCSYDPYKCPDGSQQMTTFAACNGTSWQISKVLVVCPITRPSTQCPASQPVAGSVCNSGLQCEYDLHTCPDGSTQYLTFASCNGTSWNIAKTSAVCPTVKCPAAAPAVGQSCSTAQKTLHCKYSPFTCPNGTKIYSTIATCDGTSWKIAQHTVVCPPLHTCPAQAPANLDFCTAPDDTLHCKYGLHACPDGSKQYTTFATCDGTFWRVVVALIHCPALPNLSRRCPVGQEWSRCSSACTATCKDPSPICSKQCVKGCACPASMPIWHKGKCIAHGSCPKSNKVLCMLAVTNGIDELMDAGVFLWGATERCSKAGNGLQCSSDIFSVIEKVLRMASFIVKSITACGGTDGGKKCELTGLKFSAATSGLAAASLEMGASCKSQGSVAPIKKFPLTGNANCLANVGGSFTSFGTAISALTMVKKKCQDPERCASHVLDILTAVAHMGDCIWQTIEGSCIINAQLTPYNDCVQAVVAGATNLLEVGSAALVVASDCKRTTPSRLYETGDIKTTTASSSITPLNLGLIILIPLTAVAAFICGVRDASKSLVGSRTTEFVAGIE